MEKVHEHFFCTIPMYFSIVVVIIQLRTVLVGYIGLSLDHKTIHKGNCFENKIK